MYFCKMFLFVMGQHIWNYSEHKPDKQGHKHRVDNVSVAVDYIREDPCESVDAEAEFARTESIVAIPTMVQEVAYGPL